MPTQVNVLASSLMCFTALLLLKYCFAACKIPVFQKSKNSRDNCTVTARYHGVALLNCTSICMKERNVNPSFCVGINYLAEEKTCELCNACPANLLPAPGWSLWTISDQEMNSFSSCEDWKKIGCIEDGDYTLDPDGHGGLPNFTVECKMNGPSRASETIIHHNREEKTDAGDCEAPMCSVVNVTYVAPIEQIVHVISASSRCEQYISYDCLGSSFYFNSGQYIGFYSRDGQLQDYWGGATAGSKSCACGMNNSCYTSAKCNCHLNYDKRLSDSGLITNKDALPVTKMAFGDLGDIDENGKYQLGPLKCFT